jgi:hypothetical protein
MRVCVFHRTPTNRRKRYKVLLVDEMHVARDAVRYDYLKTLGKVTLLVQITFD